MKYHPILDFNNSDAKFQSYYRIVQSNVISSYLWYRKNKYSAGAMFRLTGATVIIFSIIIPVISTNDIANKQFIITLLSLSIAIFSGLNTFYRWDEKWQSFIRSELIIKYLIGLWKLEVSNAKNLDDEDKQDQQVYKATKILLEEAGKIVSHETENYFNKVDWPKKN